MHPIATTVIFQASSSTSMLVPEPDLTAFQFEGVFGRLEDRDSASLRFDAPLGGV
jgi:hypothetical protein